MARAPRREVRANLLDRHSLSNGFSDIGGSLVVAASMIANPKSED
jgi:hypothetical protein